MEEVLLEHYLRKCEDYSVEPNKRFLKQLNYTIKQDGTIDTLVLNGNSIEMFNHRMKDLDLPPLCESLKDNFLITRLLLGYNHITDEGAHMVADMLLSNQHLKHLSLRGNMIGEDGCKALAESLKKNSTLSSIDLSENPLGDTGGLQLASMLHFNHSIRALALYNTEMKTSSIVALAIACRQHPSLYILNIGRPILHSLEEETTVHIAETLKMNSSLKEIDLAQHRIRDHGIDILTKGMLQNQFLRVLRLSSNEITIDGGMFIASFLSTNETLAELDLSSNRVDTMGGKAIADALLKNKTLKILDLTSNCIGDKTLQRFAFALNFLNNTTIQDFRISNNKFDQSSIKAFYELFHDKNRKITLDIHPHKTDQTYYIAVPNTIVKPNALLNMDKTYDENIFSLLEQYKLDQEAIISKFESSHEHIKYDDDDDDDDDNEEDVNDDEDDDDDEDNDKHNEV